MYVESAGRVVLRMNQHGTNTRNIGNLKRPPYGISHKSRAKPLAPPTIVNRQAGKKQNRDRISRDTLGKALGGILVNNIADDKRVITNDLRAIDSNVRLRNIRTLARQRVEADKAIQFLITTIEMRGVMLNRKLRDDKRYFHRGGDQSRIVGSFKRRSIRG